MKTPWRYLADLVSRKSAVEQPEKAEKNTSAIALEYRPVHQETTAPSGDQADVEGGAGADSLKRDLEDVVPSENGPALVIPDLAEGSSSPGPELVSSVAFVDEVVAFDTWHRREDEETLSLRKSTGDKTSSAKQGTNAARRSRAVAETAHVTIDDAPVAAKTVADEMADLDAEINALRHELAKKLSLQNDYLRKLLKRYLGE